MNSLRRGGHDGAVGILPPVLEQIRNHGVYDLVQLGAVDEAPGERDAVLKGRGGRVLCNVRLEEALPVVRVRDTDRVPHVGLVRVQGRRAAEIEADLLVGIKRGPVDPA
jgi:hypothetical protein